jgi:O-6-methylguanine DNA methyltransferase
MPTYTPIIHYAERPHQKFNLIWAAASEKGLWVLSYGIDQSEFIKAIQVRGDVNPIYSEEQLAPYLDQVEAYLAGTLHRFELPIDWTGMTAFQIAVRQAVMQLPYGQTASYGDIAAAVGNPRAARAVGGVQANNPISFVIPCHRVISSDGSLHGYGGFGGVQSKAWLLDLESKNN